MKWRSLVQISLYLSPLGQNISEEKSTCHGFGALIGTNSGSCFTMLTFILEPDTDM